MEEEITEGKLFATFEKFDEFFGLQQAFLNVDLAIAANAEEDAKEFNLLWKLCHIVSNPMYIKKCRRLRNIHKAGRISRAIVSSRPFS